MKKYTAILIDDEPTAISDFSCILEESLLFQVVHTFSGVEGCYRYLRENREKKVDFVFCDVELDGMTGIHGIELLRPFTEFIVLCTGYPEYALEGHQRLADGFLLKPVTLTYLVPLVDKLTVKRPSGANEPAVGHIWVRKPRAQAERIDRQHAVKENAIPKNNPKGAHRDFVRVELQDIVLFRRNGNDVDTVTLDKEGKLCVMGKSKTTVKRIFKKYEHTQLFLYANASELVHIAYIDFVDPRMIRVKGNEWISISDTCRSYFNAYMERADLSK